MKKNIFLLLTAVLSLFISACADDEEEIIAGSPCYSEGSEICSDNGIELLLCQDSAWTLKKQCNVSIGKRCRQNSDGIFGCFSDTENDVEIENDNDTSDHSTEEPDTNDNSDTENETPDDDTVSEDPTGTDNSDSEPQTDPEPTETENTETPDNDSYTTPDNDTDSDNDTDTDSQTPPAGQCSSNSDCSGSTPYCSISTSECIANAVFITEYVEGSGNNKALEIYNGSKSPVDLSNFTIQQANNGNDWGYTTNYVYNFSAAQLASGATFTVCHASIGDLLLSLCSDLASGSTLAFNGDDGMALFHGTSIVDQIGNSTDYAYWSVAGVENATIDHTLRRKTSVIQGTTDWDASAGTTAENSQWEVLIKDTYDGLGTR